MAFLLRREQQKERLRSNLAQLEGMKQENLTFDGLQTSQLKGVLGGELMREESDERERTVKIGGSSKQQQKRKAIRARSRCWNPKLPLCFNIKSLKKKNMQS